MNAPSENAAAEATRAEIRRHALELFAHYGFQKTNIGDIAERCDMSPGNLYRFYKNKQAIGVAVIRDYFDLAEAAMSLARIQAGDDAEARIRALVETGIAHIVAELERSPKIVELAEFLCEDEAGWEMLSEHILWRRARVTEDIEAGVAAGALASTDPARDATAMLNALKAFWMPMTLVGWKDRSTIMPEMRAIVDLMFKGLRA